MNKKILISLSVIGAVAALAIGGTVAYFHDVEISTGNTITAGTLNLVLGWVGGGRWYDGENMRIFNVRDVKPGDSGRRTIGIRVDGNDAFLCVYGYYTEHENECTEPESRVDKTCGIGADVDAELAENMNVKIWWDSGTGGFGDRDTYEGDNVWQSVETIYYKGPVRDLPSAMAMAARRGPFPIEAGTVYYIGTEWSVGTGVGNIIQSDSVAVNARFYAVQQKHNADFTLCPAPADVPTI